MVPLVACLADLLAPPRCLACGVRGALPWCPACDREVAASRWVGGDGLPGVDAVIAAYRYGGPVAAAIRAAKLRGASAAWPALGRRLAAAVATASPPATAVTWVPTEPGRRRARGVDHAGLLAATVAATLDLPAVAALATARGAPDRGSHGRHARPTVAPGTFRPVRRLPGAAVLLVDDVVTTGATVRAAAAALRRAGVDRVTVGVLARAGPPAADHAPSARP